MDMPGHFLALHWGWWLFIALVLVTFVVLILKGTGGGRNDS